MTLHVCQTTSCGVHTFAAKESLPDCPGCDEQASFGRLHCPECIGTGLRLTAGLDKVVVCTGCEYRIDLDEQAPAFLGHVEATTEQGTLESFGGPPGSTRSRWGQWFCTRPPAGTLGWCLEAARDSVYFCSVRKAGQLHEDDVAPERFYEELLWRQLDREFVDHDGALEETAAVRSATDGEADP